MLRGAVLHELFPQSLHPPIEHRKRPAPFKDALRGFIMRRLALIALFAGREFERHNDTAAPLVCALTVLFVGNKEFQGSQEKGPEPSLLWFRAIEIPAFKHAAEE